MRTRFSIDTATGALSRFTQGAAVPPALANILYARDKVDLEIVFTAGGEDKTAEVLQTGVKMRVGLRANTSEGVILAQSDTYTLESGVARTLFDLNTTEMVQFLEGIDPNARPAKVYCEVELAAGDESWRYTVFQQQFLLKYEVNMENDVPPAAAQESATTAAQQAALATAKAAEAKASAEAAAATEPGVVLAKVDQVANSHQPLQGLEMDGSIYGSWYMKAPGGSPFGVEAVLRADLSVAYASIVGGTTGAFGFCLTGAGQLLIQQPGVKTVGASTANVPANAETHVAYFRGADGLGRFYINGKEAGTIPDTTDYTADSIYLGACDGLAPWKGFLTNVRPYNYSKSAAAVLDLYRTGRPDPKDLPSMAAGTQLITGDGSTFASDTGWWSKNAGATIAGGACTLNGTYIYRGLLLVPGERYRVTCVGSGTYTVGDHFGRTYLAVAGSGSGEFVCSADSTTLAVYDGAGGTLSSFKLTPLGCVLLTDPTQPGRGDKWNCIVGGPISGIDGTHVRWAVPSSDVIPGPVRIENGFGALSIGADGAGSYVASNAENKAGAWSRIADGTACVITFGSGGATVYTAETGVAGSSISWVEAFKTSAAGTSIAGTSAIKGIPTAVSTQDFGLVAAGGSWTVTVTISGVSVSDCVIVTPVDGKLWSDAGNVTAEAAVTAADTISVRVMNNTAAGVPVGFRTFRVDVLTR